MFERYVVLGNGKSPGRSGESMMSGGACCAESDRGTADPDSDRWERDMYMEKS